MARSSCPGIIAFTLTCLSAPLVVLERRGVRAARCARSAASCGRASRSRSVLVTIPVLVEHEVIHAIEACADLPPCRCSLINLAGVVLVLAPVTLCEIVLAHALTTGEIDPVASA